MDYSNYRCPVCEKLFKKDDEIVVCPECGAPHHRDCYDIENRCFFEDKHAEGFDFKVYATQKNETNNNYNYENTNNNTQNNNNQNTQESDIIACLNCGTFNVSTNDVCQNCGTPLDKNNKYKQYDRHSTESQTPYPENNKGQEKPFSTSFVFDPMGGLKPEEDLGDGVTVSEVSKFTQKNSPFFCRLFHQIKRENRSRFSFVGFIFSGGWLLYRKMYKLGIFITTLLGLMIISQLFIETYYGDLLNNVMKIPEGSTYFSQMEAMSTAYLNLNFEDKLVFTLYSLSLTGQIALRVICAVCGNRWYYKHSIKTISKIKNNSGTKEAADTAIQEKGGVNNALAWCLLATYAVLSFLPYFFT